MPATSNLWNCKAKDKPDRNQNAAEEGAAAGTFHENDSCISKTMHIRIFVHKQDHEARDRPDGVTGCQGLTFRPK